MTIHNAYGFTFAMQDPDTGAFEEICREPDPMLGHVLSLVPQIEMSFELQWDPDPEFGHPLDHASIRWHFAQAWGTRGLAAVGTEGLLARGSRR